MERNLSGLTVWIIFAKRFGMAVYWRVNVTGLFHLYSKVPLSELPDKLIVIFSHVNYQRQITKCFAKDCDNDLMQRIFDNSLTNAITASLMLEDTLEDCTIGSV